MTYIDGFVAAVKTTDKETYRAHCQQMAGVFKEFGSTGLNGGGTAFDQLTALAQKYLKDHSGENITSEQAFAKVYADPANKQLRIQEARESGRQ